MGVEQISFLPSNISSELSLCGGPPNREEGSSPRICWQCSIMNFTNSQTCSRVQQQRDQHPHSNISTVCLVEFKMNDIWCSLLHWILSSVCFVPIPPHNVSPILKLDVCSFSIKLIWNIPVRKACLFKGVTIHWLTGINTHKYLVPATTCSWHFRQLSFTSNKHVFIFLTITFLSKVLIK